MDPAKIQLGSETSKLQTPITKGRTSPCLIRKIFPGQTVFWQTKGVADLWQKYVCRMDSEEISKEENNLLYENGD